ARVLDPYRIARIDAELEYLAKCLRHPGRDEHLLGGAPHAARGCDMTGDRLAQPAMSRGVGTLEQRDVRVEMTARDELRPLRDRKQLERGHAGPERARRSTEPRRSSRQLGP